MNKPTCVIYAPIDSFSGYGSASRERVKSIIELYKDKWDIKIISCGWGNLPLGFLSENKQWTYLEEYIIIENLTYKPNIMIWMTIPTEAQNVGDYNILFTAGIETTICAPEWIQGVNRMDLTIVPSEHAKKVFIDTTYDQKDNRTQQVVGVLKITKPIEVIGEGFDENIYNFLPTLPQDSSIKQEIDQIKEKFCFLFTGSWLNGNFGEDRKNITGLIKVFLETFKNKKVKPALILKTAIGSCSIPNKEEILRRIEEIRKTVKSQDLPNIYLFHGDITDEEMNELYNHPKIKAMVSLTKGEGYGRPLIEFTQTKKPLIVSGWSGHLDFCKPEFTSLLPGNVTPIHPSAQVKGMLVEGSGWFSVDLGHACAIMKDHFENYNKYKDNGPRLGYYCKTNFNQVKIKEKLGEVLDREVKLPYSIKLPPLKLVK